MGNGFAVCVCVVQCLRNGFVLERDGGGKVKEMNNAS